MIFELDIHQAWLFFINQTVNMRVFKKANFCTFKVETYIYKYQPSMQKFQGDKHDQWQMFSATPKANRFGLSSRDRIPHSKLCIRIKY